MVTNMLHVCITRYVEFTGMNSRNAADLYEAASPVTTYTPHQNDMKPLVSASEHHQDIAGSKVDPTSRRTTFDL